MLVRWAFLVTKFGSPAVKNGSPGRRTSAIFQPLLSIGKHDLKHLKVEVKCNFNFFVLSLLARVVL